MLVEAGPFKWASRNVRRQLRGRRFEHPAPGFSSFLSMNIVVMIVSETNSENWDQDHYCASILVLLSIIIKISL
jgi:hypothetical protein